MGDFWPNPIMLAAAEPIPEKKLLTDPALGLGVLTGVVANAGAGVEEPFDLNLS